LDALSAGLKPFEARKPPDPGRISDETSAVMIRKIDDKAVGSAFQRVLAERAAEPAERVEPTDSEASPAEEAEQGWDPYDVWLRRVHQPRSRGGGETSSD
jgi:hypothetical protein